MASKIIGSLDEGLGAFLHSMGGMGWPECPWSKNASVLCRPREEVSASCFEVMGKEAEPWCNLLPQKLTIMMKKTSLY